MTYQIKTIRTIVDSLREIYPCLRIENVIDDIEKSVESLGVDVQYSNFDYELDSISGFLAYENNRPVIVLNATESTRRQRFTLAHELGHLILHWNWLPGEKPSDSARNLFEVSYRNKKDYSKEEMLRETEADSFAGEFLLPLKKVKESLDNTNSKSIVRTLSNDFKVSESCAYVRVSNLQREGELSD